MRLDDRKDVQSVKLRKSICIQRRKSASYSLSRKIIKDVRRTLTVIVTSVRFYLSVMFNLINEKQ